MRRTRVLFGTVLALAALVGGSFALTASLRMQNPVFLTRYLVTDYSDLGELFAYRTVHSSPNPRPAAEALQKLPSTVNWNGEKLATSKALAKTNTNALLVLCEDSLVYEWYRSPEEADELQSSWSVAKSVVGLLIGQLIDEGRLTEETPMVEVLDEFADVSGFERITIGHLLDMQSGIDLEENYSYFRPFWGVGGLQITTDLPYYLKKNASLRFEPGSQAEYRSVDVQYLSMVVSRIEGETLAEVAERKLWQAIGAENDARWNLDREGGIEKGFSALNATPRDFSKIGLLITNRGKVGDRQVVSEAWIDRITSPRVQMEDEWEYSTLWWYPPGHEVHGDLSALGVYGQYVYVNPSTEAVAVKLSDYGAETQEQQVVDMLRELTSVCS